MKASKSYISMSTRIGYDLNHGLSQPLVSMRAYAASGCGESGWFPLAPSIRSPYMSAYSRLFCVILTETSRIGVNEVMNEYQPGQIVYVIIRNPHVQGVANVQEAAVVNDPDSPGNYALFIYETYYPLNDEVAVYPTASEAEHAYREAFGLSDMGAYYG